MILVKNRIGAGLRRLEVDKGVAGGAPGAFQAAAKPHGNELFADVPNFTDITPHVQISEIIYS